MAKKLYIKKGNIVYDALLYNLYKKKSGTTVHFREGDLVKSGSFAYPITRFDTVPFRGSVSGSNMIFTFGLNNKVYKSSPITIVGIGSSTMEGYGLTAPNRYWDNISAWAATQSTTPNMINLGLGGQDSNALMPTSMGGTVGRNIDTALTYNPSLIILDEPTNWAAVYDENAQITKWETIFNYAWSRGVPVVFNGPRPRTPYDTIQKARLVNLFNLLKVHPYLRYVCNNDFQDYVKSGTTADLRTDWDQGDGIHLNATGISHLAVNTENFMINSVFRDITAYSAYEIHSSSDNNVFTLFDTITDLTLYSKSYSLSAGYYKIRGKLKDGTYTNFSPSVQIVDTPIRLLFDLGGDGRDQGGGVSGGSMTPNNTPTTPIPGVDASGKYWNNLIDFRAGNITPIQVVDTNNNNVAFTLSLDKFTGGTFNGGVGKGQNYLGPVPTSGNVGDYPTTAVQDNCYVHSSAGVVTITGTMPAGKTASIKFWGARVDTGTTPRILQVTYNGVTTEYDGRVANNDSASYTTQSTTVSGITGPTFTITINTKVGSDFGHISILDVTLT